MQAIWLVLLFAVTYKLRFLILKYIIYPLLFLLVDCCFAQKQEWAPLGAVWHYPILEYPTFPQKGYLKIESIKDTLISSKSSKKMKESVFNSSGSSTHKYFYMYGENGRVFYWAKNGFHLLYDFNSKKGDTYLVRKPFEFYNLEFKSDSMITVHIDSVSYQIVNGDTLKLLYSNFNSSSEWRFPDAKTTEKIGNNYFVLPYWNLQLRDTDVLGGLRCYSDNRINISHALPCNELISNTRDNQINIELQFKNPIEELFSIESHGLIIRNIDIYSTLGQKINSYESIFSSSFSRDLRISPGFYLIHILFENNSQQIIRIIKK